MADIAAQEQRTGPGKPFPKGKSGNPAGKPKGCRNKATRAAQVLLDGEAEALTRKAVELALEGDTTALRICMERICPPTRERALDADAIKLPLNIDAENAGQVFGEIFRAVSGGRIYPGEGDMLVKMLRSYLEAHEYQQIAERIAELEDAAPRGRKW